MRYLFILFLTGCAITEKNQECKFSCEECKNVEFTCKDDSNRERYGPPSTNTGINVNG